jgi:hypothetical protein
MKKETPSDFAAKSIRKDFSAKKKGNGNKDSVVFEDKRPGSEPYKKPKTHFKHYLEEHLDDEDESLDYL